MTDKVQKIREEVERLKRWNNNVRNSTRHMTLQEEDFNRGKHSSYLEILNFIDSLQEESVSEDLEEAAEHYLYSNILYDDVYVGNPTEKDCIEMFKAGANWQKKQMMSKAINGEWFRCGIVLPSKYYADDVKKVKITIWQDGV